MKLFKNRLGFNPFGTGRGLSTTSIMAMNFIRCFNPFGTGRGLSTIQVSYIHQISFVLIPLEQGGVFRLRGWFGALMDKAWEDRFPTFPLMRKVRYGFD
ncbi:conserved hypothetical protein [Aggregatibacter segnis ATCC 33393]|uniref:Uncharacterized protein n=1 Tax=Aggregatibacter segnis ATCC 33393 TaxID=888057 RepID=E6L009_9PAST|nr:conserved hypothetical protein [Aggregatibacter segnis ATCC 33393]